MKHYINQIDNLLPQTQCGQCGYGGCLPYAEAMAIKGEAINRCPPGGVKTLIALGKLLNKDPAPFIDEMSAQEKPSLTAVIREAECIGCTKCIQACPVDAIIGSAKQMHTVLLKECTGCGLCVTPCPVDCIDMIEIPAPSYDPNKARARYQARQQRKNHVGDQPVAPTEVEIKKAYIQAAIERAKTKKLA